MPNPVIPPPLRPSGRPVTKMTFMPAVLPKGPPLKPLGAPVLANAKGADVIGIDISGNSVAMGPFICMAPLLLLADEFADEALM
mmetsp:Transcript_3539/g.6845  ORF Transcript_3539/g.6845 Transcript_3539/m.6845 type:complete len:84 (+) Transcript_3539:682-933(+)